MKNIIVLGGLMISLVCHAQHGEKDASQGDSATASEEAYGIGEAVHSKSMNRDLPVLVFTPADYRKTKGSYPVVYFLHGSGNQPLEAPLLEENLRKGYPRGLRIQEACDYYRVIIVAPLVGNTYYLNAPLKPAIRFATYVGEELPAFIDSKYRTLANRDNRFLAGFSMGGYGAVSLLCRYPDTFSVALSRAGVMNLATEIEDLDWDAPASNVVEMLGDYWTNRENWHRNSCFNLINPVRHRKDIAVVVEIGVDDYLYKTNKRFKERLDELKVSNIYSEYPGGHYWDANVLNSLLAHLQYFHKTVQ